MIDNRPTITRVRPGSSGERLGLQPGFIVTHIGGRELKVISESRRPLRPVEERFAVRRTAQRRLSGAATTKVTLRYLDHDDKPHEVMLVRDAPKILPVRLGHLPPIYPEVHTSQVGDVGIISFNIFLLQPVLEDIKRAMNSFRARQVRGLILDLRGNPGGQGAMAIPIAAQLVSQELVLGTIQFRDFSQTLTARPELGSRPFAGPVVIITDEGSASASEILAAGLQEAKRAMVVGDATLGAVLPSVIESLPGGAVMQFVVADFKTPKGVTLEGRGVQPDRRVVETRAGLRSGRDPVLDAALVAIRASRPR
jgi:carboxyl-terminal processing protease